MSYCATLAICASVHLLNNPAALFAVYAGAMIAGGLISLVLQVRRA